MIWLLLCIAALPPRALEGYKIYIYGAAFKLGDFYVHKKKKKSELIVNMVANNAFYSPF